MKFKKIKKRKVYETWVAHCEKCVIYIFKILIEKNEFYHYQIISYEKEKYSSLIEYSLFSNFDLCCKEAQLKSKQYCKKM